MMGTGNSSRTRDFSWGWRSNSPGIVFLNKTILDPTAPLHLALVELPSPGWLHQSPGNCDDPPADPGQTLRRSSQTIQGPKNPRICSWTIIPFCSGLVTSPSCSGPPAGTSTPGSSPGEAAMMVSSCRQLFIEIKWGVFLIFLRLYLCFLAVPLFLLWLSL